VQKGDTLWDISRRTYGDGRLWTTLFLTNQGQIANPHLIFPGQVLEIPE
jgi:nucleoid-associated protein YgaU